MITHRQQLVTIALAALTASGGCKTQPQPATESFDVPLPEITASSTPHQVATTFLQTLELFLEYEHTNPDRAEACLAYAANLVTEAHFDRELRALGAKREKLDPNKVAQTKKRLATAYVTVWAAAINYYTGHITYARPATTAPATQARTVSIRFPARRDGPTRPVNIVVSCVREDTWKIKRVGLTPQSNASAPK